MPLLALLLAREGIPVLIQGRHDFESRVSPFTLLAALGITPAESIPAAEAELGARHLACLPVSARPFPQHPSSRSRRHATIVTV